MNRSESDLRDALARLEQEADRVGAPPASELIAAAEKTPSNVRVLRRRWLPPLAAAALVAGTALAVAIAADGSNDESAPVGSDPSPTAATSSSVRPSPTKSTTPDAAPQAILDDAAGKLDELAWKPPARNKFFYVKTTDATTWASVSGRKTGLGRASDGTPIAVPGCQNGKYTPGSGQDGPCTLDYVQHYRADAPVAPNAWDQYLESIAPGARAGGAQGKIIVQVLHQDLISPRATAGLLRFTKSCKGLHTIDVKPVDGRKLVGVTCTSMSAGSYGLAFDAATHAYVGFVPVDESGKQADAAEIILRTATVSRPGQKP